MQDIVWDDIKKYIPEENKRVGVMVSGGWDSACLWYMVKKICTERGMSCEPFVVPKLDGALVASQNVIKTLSKKLGVSYQEPTVVGKELSNNPWDYVTNGAWDIFGETADDRLVDFLFVGMTAFDDEVHQRHEKEDPHPRFEPEEWMREFVAWPFENHTKDKTIKLGFDIGIADVIMPITHSCTELQEGRCNKCYWCTERQWAFEKAGYLDTGTN